MNNRTLLLCAIIIAIIIIAVLIYVIRRQNKKAVKKQATDLKMLRENWTFSMAGAESFFASIKDDLLTNLPKIYCPAVEPLCEDLIEHGYGQLSLLTDSVIDNLSDLILTKSQDMVFNAVDIIRKFIENTVGGWIITSLKNATFIDQTILPQFLNMFLTEAGNDEERKKQAFGKKAFQPLRTFCKSRLKALMLAPKDNLIDKCEEFIKDKTDCNWNNTRHSATVVSNDSQVSQWQTLRTCIANEDPNKLDPVTGLHINKPKRNSDIMSSFIEPFEISVPSLWPSHTAKEEDWGVTAKNLACDVLEPMCDGVIRPLVGAFEKAMDEALSQILNAVSETITWFVEKAWIYFIQLVLAVGGWFVVGGALIGAAASLLKNSLMTYLGITDRRENGDQKGIVENLQDLTNLVSLDPLIAKMNYSLRIIVGDGMRKIIYPVRDRSINSCKQELNNVLSCGWSQRTNDEIDASYKKCYEKGPVASDDHIDKKLKFQLIKTKRARRYMRWVGDIRIKVSEAMVGKEEGERTAVYKQIISENAINYKADEKYPTTEKFGFLKPGVLDTLKSIQFMPPYIAEETVCRITRKPCQILFNALEKPIAMASVGFIKYGVENSKGKMTSELRNIMTSTLTHHKDGFSDNSVLRTMFELVLKITTVEDMVDKCFRSLMLDKMIYKCCDIVGEFASTEILRVLEDIFAKATTSCKNGLNNMADDFTTDKIGCKAVIEKANKRRKDRRDMNTSLREGWEFNDVPAVKVPARIARHFSKEGVIESAIRGMDIASGNTPSDPTNKPNTSGNNDMSQIIGCAIIRNGCNRSVNHVYSKVSSLVGETLKIYMKKLHSLIIGVCLTQISRFIGTNNLVLTALVKYSVAAVDTLITNDTDMTNSLLKNPRDMMTSYYLDAYKFMQCTGIILYIDTVFLPNIFSTIISSVGIPANIEDIKYTCIGSIGSSLRCGDYYDFGKPEFQDKGPDVYTKKESITVNEYIDETMNALNAVVDGFDLVTKIKTGIESVEANDLDPLNMGDAIANGLVVNPPTGKDSLILFTLDKLQSSKTLDIVKQKLTDFKSAISQTDAIIQSDIQDSMASKNTKDVQSLTEQKAIRFNHATDVPETDSFDGGDNLYY
jgi:hypothetical protein